MRPIRATNDLLRLLFFIAQTYLIEGAPQETLEDASTPPPFDSRRLGWHCSRERQVAGPSPTSAPPFVGGLYKTFAQNPVSGCHGRRQIADPEILGVGCAKHSRLRIPAPELVAAGKTTLERWGRMSETFQAEDISQLTWVRTTVVVPRTTKPQRSPNVLSRKLTSTAVSKSVIRAEDALRHAALRSGPDAQQPRGLSQPRLAPTAEARVALLTNGPQNQSTSIFRQCRHRRKGGKNVLANAATFTAVVGNGAAMAVGFLDACSMNTPGDGNPIGARFTVAELEPGTIFPEGSIYIQMNEGCVLGLSPDIVAATLGDIRVETVEGLDKLNRRRIPRECFGEAHEERLVDPSWAEEELA
ncbi:hypothetical protein B0H11DRAFT_1904238 [Mycena galericulata]|nr:hypothetical protein B0H11DRAFT_1904238 [Mycena galericulata]